MRVPTDVARSGKRMATAATERPTRCCSSLPHWVVLPHRSTPSSRMKAPLRTEEEEAEEEEEAAELGLVGLGWAGGGGGGSGTIWFGLAQDSEREVESSRVESREVRVV